MTIRIGDRVLVQGLFTGTVKYVGDLDSNYIDDQTYIGVKLDEPGRYTKAVVMSVVSLGSTDLYYILYIIIVGKSDGVYEGKRFFECPNMHGIIVPIHHIHLLVPREVIFQPLLRFNFHA